MKVNLLVLNPFTNDTRVHKTAKFLAKAGYEVTVTALWKDGLEKFEVSSGYEINRLKLGERIKWNRTILLAIRYIEYALKIWQSAGKDPADIYHANDAITLPAAWLAARRASSKVVYDAHELETGRDFSSSTLSGIYRHLWALPEKVFIRQANAVVTVCQSIAHELARLYSIPTPKIVMNCPEKWTGQRSNRLREELAIPDEHKIVLYQGRITEGRGIEILFDAIQPLSNVAAVALGEGPLLEEYRSYLRQGKWNRVYLPGKVPLEELLSYSSSADIGVIFTEDTCLNHHFALPNKLFEYIQAGIPVIGSDLPEIANVILKNKIGHVIPPGDTLSITRAISRMIEIPSEYNVIKAYTQKAAEIYTWEIESQKLLQAYQLIIEDAS